MKSIKKAAACISVMLSITLAACSQSHALRLGTGNTGGNYYTYGNALSSISDTELTVKETAGSTSNLRLMDEGFIDMAIVQSDVLSEAVNGTGDFTGNKVDRVRAVAGLYTEAFQIIVSSDSGIESLSDLRGKAVSVGEEGSGVAENAEYILRSAGLDYSMIDKRSMTYTESAAALENGTVDAFFMISGTPSTVISELSRNMSLKVLSLDERTVSYMTNLYKGYSETMIPAGTYQGQDEDITTIGVKAVLVASSTADTSRINGITKTLFEKSGDLKYSVSVSEPDPAFASSDIPCAFHKGAADYYSSIGINVSTETADASERLIFGAQDE